MVCVRETALQRRPGGAFTDATWREAAKQVSTRRAERWFERVLGRAFIKGM